MKVNRKWSCKRQGDNYCLTLQCDDIILHSLIHKSDLQETLIPNSYLEYQIIRLNKALSDKLLPLTRYIDVGFHK